MKKFLLPAVAILIGLSGIAYYFQTDQPGIPGGGEPVLSANAGGAEGSSGPASAEPTAAELEAAAKAAAEKEAAEKEARLREEREALEKQRREELGEFYVPLPALGQERQLSTVKAKGLYITAYVAGFDFDEKDVAYYADYVRSISGQSGKAPDTSRLGEVNKLERALALCESSEINALVIDVKNDSGLVAWDSDIAIVNQLKSNWSKPLKNYPKLMDYLQKHDIYAIARIVAFKDPFFAKHESAHAIQLKAGGVYRDRSGTAWVNPFDEYVWKYLIAVSREAALRGFNEIQFDYVRFPDGAKSYNPITVFPGRNDRDKDEGIEDFLKYAREALKPYNVHIAADVFAVITHTWDDKPEDIGQTWRKIANPTDYICPMIYPSHYNSGFYGYSVPDANPYGVSRKSLLEAIEQSAAEKETALIRPWFQGFTATWVKGHIPYNAKTISDQMVAAAELGVEEYIIWNVGNSYDPKTFFYQDRIRKDLQKDGEDLLGRTPSAALKKYLDALKSKRLNTLYLLTPIAEREEDFDAFAAGSAASLQAPKSYEILSTVQEADGSYASIVKAAFPDADGTVKTLEVTYHIILEKDVYKISAKSLQ